MMTLQQHYAALAADHPVVTAVRNGVAVRLSEEERVATLERWAAARYAAQLPKTPEPITPRQLRRWLHSQGLLSQVPYLIASIPNADERALAEIDWEYALSFKADHPLVVAFAQQLQLTTDQLYAAWREAANF